MFGFSKCLFARLAENLPDGASFPLDDAVIKVLKRPIQSLAESPPDTGLAGSHKADQKDSPARGGSLFIWPLLMLSDVLIRP
jgi:hypothetical protein